MKRQKSTINYFGNKLSTLSKRNIEW